MFSSTLIEPTPIQIKQSKTKCLKKNKNKRRKGGGGQNNIDGSFNKRRKQKEALHVMPRLKKMKPTNAIGMPLRKEKGLSSLNPFT